MKTITDIRLTHEQQAQQHRYYMALIESNIAPALACEGARILLQDELLGFEARTETQQQQMNQIRDFCLNA